MAAKVKPPFIPDLLIHARNDLGCELGKELFGFGHVHAYALPAHTDQEGY